MVWSAHGAAASTLSHNSVATLDTGAKVVTVTGTVGQRLEMLHDRSSFGRYDWFIITLCVVVIL